MAEIKRRRKYDREFKEQAVTLLLQGDKTTEQVAEELGIHWGMLSRWKREYLERLEEQNPEKPVSTMEEEVRHLRKEVASLRAQRDILKKALSIFSQTSNGGSDS